jgi:hypothetical protein
VHQISVQSIVRTVILKTSNFEGCRQNTRHKQYNQKYSQNCCFKDNFEYSTTDDATYITTNRLAQGDSFIAQPNKQLEQLLQPENKGYRTQIKFASID